MRKPSVCYGIPVTQYTSYDSDLKLHKVVLDGLYIHIKLLNVKRKFVPVCENHVMETCRGFGGECRINTLHTQLKAHEDPSAFCSITRQVEELKGCKEDGHITVNSLILSISSSRLGLLVIVAMLLFR
jgi:hypothetical protein